MIYKPSLIEEKMEVEMDPNIKIKEEVQDESIFEEIQPNSSFEIKEEADEDEIVEMKEIKFENCSEILEPKYEENEEELVGYDMATQNVYMFINNANEQVSVVNNPLKQEVTIVPTQSTKFKKVLQKRKEKLQKLKTKKMVHCQECKAKFYSSYTLLLHEKTHILDTAFTCDKCPEGFSSLGLLMEHQKAMKHFKATDTFQEKVRALHKRTYKCKACGLIFYSEKTFRFHVKVHAGLLKYSCDFCDEMFNTLSELTYHRETFGHGLKCQQCGIVCSTVQEMEQHTKMHTKWTFFKCTDCNFATVVQKHFRRHRAKCPGIEKDPVPVMCSACGSMFQTKDIYDKHVCPYSEVKPEDPVVVDENSLNFVENDLVVEVVKEEES